MFRSALLASAVAGAAAFAPGAPLGVTSTTRATCEIPSFCSRAVLRNREMWLASCRSTHRILREIGAGGKWQPEGYGSRSWPQHASARLAERNRERARGPHEGN